MIIFNPASTKHLQALFFGGEFKEIIKKPVIENGQLVLIKSGINKDQIKYKNQEDIIKIIGLQLFPEKHWITEKGNISLNETILKELAQFTLNKEAMQIADLILKIRGLEKQISTYYTAIQELTYDIDKCIHGEFKHVATETGRLSSANPNMQNIPRKQSKAKQHFITRYK